MEALEDLFELQEMGKKNEKQENRFVKYFL
jgi:hypothetical protein